MFSVVFEVMDTTSCLVSDVLLIEIIAVLLFFISNQTILFLLVFVDFEVITARCDA